MRRSERAFDPPLVPVNVSAMPQPADENAGVLSLTPSPIVSRAFRVLFVVILAAGGCNLVHIIAAAF
jgi:hypothetical protein